MEWVDLCDGYYSIKPLWSDMGELVPGRTSPTLPCPIPSLSYIISNFMPNHSWLIEVPCKQTDGSKNILSLAEVTSSREEGIRTPNKLSSRTIETFNNSGRGGKVNLKGNWNGKVCEVIIAWSDLSLCLFSFERLHKIATRRGRSFVLGVTKNINTYTARPVCWREWISW